MKIVVNNAVYLFMQGFPVYSYKFKKCSPSLSLLIALKHTCISFCLHCLPTAFFTTQHFYLVGSLTSSLFYSQAAFHLVRGACEGLFLCFILVVRRYQNVGLIVLLLAAV